MACEHPTLADYLKDWSGGGPTRDAVSATLVALAEASARLSALIAEGPFVRGLGATVGDGGGGDIKKFLDVEAHKMFKAALANAPVAAMGSEEADQAEILNEGAPLVVAIDPLDGSSNIDTNVSIGTIFSILPAAQGMDPNAALLQAGSQQLASGFFVYGPQTTLVVSVREGTHIFTMAPHDRVFRLTQRNLKINPDKAEYAINASNARHWPDAVKAYMRDLDAGKDGPREKDFNMRWVGSLVAEAYRILIRGGIFLYPGDARKGYEQGRLRLVYEAIPIALLMSEAGGAATDGLRPILEIKPDDLHQRVPLVFGPPAEVERISRYHEAQSEGEASPLFSQRGLLRS
ncbi:MAG: fructose 1,6-bisphosphatase [Alphaproteobacteria bacterium BRH_c36]|nr:MAG: fructose 1,6-bisphosphatase [Alphaproteobacteria bacterium BRH_c36]